jgi:hypothetical protein
MNNQEFKMTNEDIAIIKGLFADNKSALKVLRKVFYPEITVDAPLGANFDLWMTTPVDEMSSEQAIVNIKAKSLLIRHVEQCLMNLNTLAGTKQETVEETKARILASSSK